MAEPDDYTELIKEIVDAAPPPTPELLRQLAALFDYTPPSWQQ